MPHEGVVVGQTLLALDAVQVSVDWGMVMVGREVVDPQMHPHAEVVDSHLGQM